MHDPSGHKKNRVRRIEQLIFKCAVISSMIPSDTMVKYNDPCNWLHNEWHNPWNPSIPRTESVLDLINKSMGNYINRMDMYMKVVGVTSFVDMDLDPSSETNNYLYYRNRLLVNLSDLSYLSGLPL